MRGIVHELKIVDRKTILKPTKFYTIDGFQIFQTEAGVKVKLSRMTALCWKILNSKWRKGA